MAGVRRKTGKFFSWKSWQAFDYHHINKSPAVFDIPKLRWMNGEYIKKWIRRLFMKSAALSERGSEKGIRFQKIAAMVQTRIETFPDIPNWLHFLRKCRNTILPCTATKNEDHGRKRAHCSSGGSAASEAQEDYTNDAFTRCSALCKRKRLQNGYVMWPIRTAASGKQMTPAGATEIMEIIGKDETIRRIQAAIEKLSGCLEQA